MPIYEATEGKVSSTFFKESEVSSSSKTACGKRIIQALYNRIAKNRITTSWVDHTKADYSDNTE